MKEKCPCEECLVKPICKERSWDSMKKLFSVNCENLSSFLGYTSDGGSIADIEIHKKNFKIFYNILKPKIWRIKHWNGAGYIITKFGDIDF